MKTPGQVPAPLSVKQNALWNGIGCTVYQGCQWLITVLVVVLSANYENSGILAYAMTIGNILTPVATYSMRTFQVSDIENKYSQQNYIGFRFITMIIGLLVTLAYTLAITPSATTVATVVIYLVFKLDESFSTVLYGIDQKAYRMDYIGVSQFVRGALSLGAFSCVLYVTKNLDAAVATMFASCFLVTLFYDLPHSKRFGSILPSIKAAQAATLLRVCFPAVLSSLFCGMVVSVARQYFGIVNGDEALGIYAAVATPSVVIQLFAQYLYNPAIGPIAEKWVHGTKQELVGYLFKLLGVMLGAIAVVVVILSLAGSPLLVLVFGQSIVDYTFLFPPVLISTGLIAFMWFCTDVLVVFRNFKGVLLANSVALGVCLASMQFFIGLWYMNGVTFAIIAAYVVGLIVGGASMARCIGRHFAE